MRVLSYIVAIVLLLTGPSMAGSADNDLPGIGTFSYNGSPLVPGTDSDAATNSADDRSGICQ